MSSQHTGESKPPQSDVVPDNSPKATREKNLKALHERIVREKLEIEQIQKMIAKQFPFFTEETQAQYLRALLRMGVSK